MKQNISELVVLLYSQQECTITCTYYTPIGLLLTDKLYRVDQFHRQFGEAVYSIDQIDIIFVVSQ